MTALTAALLATTLAPSLGRALAPSPEPIRYVVRIADPRTHYLDVEAVVPTGGASTIELMMAVWTPGSYLIREFARHVQEVTARDVSGRELVITKSAKNRWRVRTGGARQVVVHYRVYANEHQPRTNWVDTSFAIINGAPTYLTLVGGPARTHDVQLQLPVEWTRSLTALVPGRDGVAHHYSAPDYDALVDSPIVVGNPAEHFFTVDGIRHAVVLVGDTSQWDAARSARDVQRVVEQARGLWGALPYDRYLFFNILAGEYDGIEHKGSTGLVAPPAAMASDTAYHAWLQLVAHEFFHAWNVKRMRPAELGPFDYEHEVYTRSLWIAEGLSDYYSWLLLARAGLATRREALADISAAIRALQATPGRRIQSVEQASFDAWIKQYRPDENSVNTAISYYIKGSVVGLVLDARIRHLTAGKKSLDDVMRLAYRRYSGARGYTRAQFRSVAREVAGADLDQFFQDVLEGTGELDYREALVLYGLRFADASDAAPWTLEPRPDATPVQRAALEALLGAR